MRLSYAFVAGSLMLGVLSANTLSYTFTGVGSGILNGTSFTNQTITFSLTANTTNSNYTPAVPDAFFSVSGFGSGEIRPGVSYIVLSDQVASFNIGTTNPAVVTNPLLSTYDLRDPAGPVVSTTPYAPTETIFPTSLGDLTITSSITFTFSAAAVSALTYTVEDVCAPATCFAEVLNDNGQVAGSTASGLPGPFASFSGSTLVPLETPAKFVFKADGLTAMNNAGVIVGSMYFLGDPQSSSSPPGYYGLAWRPSIPAPQCLILPAGSADYINNENNIVGEAPIPPLIPGVTLYALWAITDNGNIIGVLSDGTIVAYTPGCCTDFLNPVESAGSRIFNSLGQVVFATSGPFSTSLYTPGKGLTTLPNGFPLAINDSGLIVFAVEMPPPVGSTFAIYDSSGTFPNISTAPVPLNSLIPADSGWQAQLTGDPTLPVPQGVAINNLGQILVPAMNSITGRSTSILLMPGNFPAIQTSTSISRARPEAKLESSDSRCLAASLNSFPIPSCSDVPVHPPGRKPPAIH